MIFGLLTKQEAKELRDLTPQDIQNLKFIANLITQSQYEYPSQTSGTFNMVVGDAVEGFFKNTMQYSTDYVKQGYPAGQGLLRSISWA